MFKRNDNVAVRFVSDGEQRFGRVEDLTHQCTHVVIVFHDDDEAEQYEYEPLKAAAEELEGCFVEVNDYSDPVTINKV